MKAILGLIMLLSVVSPDMKAAALKVSVKDDADTSMTAEIQALVSNKKTDLSLNYPVSVQRFYTNTFFSPAWIKQQAEHRQTWDVMLLLDCVLQYGLSHADYHPKELNYDLLHAIFERPGKVSNKTKARFEVTLTDALITFMNHLHYGKLNPEYAAGKIDKGQATPFHAEDVLLKALNDRDIAHPILAVQPTSKQYAALQDRLRLLKGQYQEDCYTVPESEVRKIAINMERLRWADIDERTYIQINVPSYTLKLYTPDSVYQFKVIVGKPSAPTPSLHSDITYLTTTPEWKVPQKIFVNELLPKALKYPDYLANSHFVIYNRNGNYVNPSRAMLKQIQRDPSNYYARQSPGCDENALGTIVFRFQNQYGIFLHDTPEQKLFQREERPFSHSCIRVEHTRELAEMVLKLGNAGDKIPEMDKALKNHRTRNISLRKAMPIKITYLTCEVDQGLMTNYKDVYDLDKSLELALYGNVQAITQNK